MCERAGLLDPMEPVDYSSLTEETFDWNLWIQQESGKRSVTIAFQAHGVDQIAFMNANKILKAGL